MTDFEATPQGDPGLLFDEHDLPKHPCPSCGSMVFDPASVKVDEDDEAASGDTASTDDRRIVAELRALRQGIKDLRWSLVVGLSKPPDAEEMRARFGIEPPMGRLRRLFRRLKARFVEWRDGDRDAGPTGNDRCRRDVWSGRQYVEPEEASE